MCLSQQKFCCDKYTFVATNTCLSWQTHVCRDKSMLVGREIFCCNTITWENVCHDKLTFVATKDAFCNDQHTFVTTKLLSWQAYFCRNKRCVLQRPTHVCHYKTFVMTSLLLSQQKMCFATTNTRLSLQNVCHDKLTFVATKDVFCNDQHTFVTTKRLSWQAYFCRNKRCVLQRPTHVCHYKTFVMTSLLLSQQKMCFATTNTRLSLQNVCHDKLTFVATKDVFCNDQHTFVTTKRLSWQAYFCRNKRCVLQRPTHVCHYKTFVMTSLLLSQQKMCFATTNTRLSLQNVCHDKLTFVATKDVFCNDQHTFVTPKLLSWQAYFCRNKRCVLQRPTHVCHYKTFVMTSLLLSQQKMCFATTNTRLSLQNFCHDKLTFVATKDVFCNDQHTFVTTKRLSWQAYFCRNKRCVLQRPTHVCHSKTFVTTKMILLAAPATDTFLHKLEPPKVCTHHWKWTGTIVLDKYHSFTIFQKLVKDKERNIWGVATFIFSTKVWKLSSPHYLADQLCTLALLKSVKNLQHLDQNHCPHQQTPQLKPPWVYSISPCSWCWRHLEHNK